jgi:uncharacterized protein (TIGR00290 family)
MTEPVLLSWSGGKDSALALSRLRADPGFDVVGLITTVTTAYDRVSIHGVRRSLLRDQAAALGLPLHEVEVAAASSNAEYEAAWNASIRTLPAELRPARRIAFGDIFLADVRAYREDQARALGYDALFPLWDERTDGLAHEIIDSGIVATVVCVDTTVLSANASGRRYDRAFVAALPTGADPCGERGEFHTFVSWGEHFQQPVPFVIGETVMRDNRFAYTDLLQDVPLDAGALAPGAAS